SFGCLGHFCDHGFTLSKMDRGCPQPQQPRLAGKASNFPPRSYCSRTLRLRTAAVRFIRHFHLLQRSGAIVNFLNQRSQSGGIEEGSVTNLVAGTIFEAIGFATREGGEIKCRGEV